MNTSPKAGVHSLLPPDPHYGGRPPVRYLCASGGQNQDGLVLLAPGHWALPSEILKVYTLYGHRLLWHNRGSWALVDGAKRNKKSGSDENVTPTKVFLTGAEAKRSFAQSFFASFFL